MVRDNCGVIPQTFLGVLVSSHVFMAKVEPQIGKWRFHPPVLGIRMLAVALGESSSSYYLVIALRLKRKQFHMAHGLNSDHRIRVLVERKRLV